MPTNEMTTTKQETWADWFPDAPEEALGTIDDLLGTLEDRKKQPEDPKVTADNIRYWQKAGILPAPIKRWHDGATRAIYPTIFAVVVIWELLELKRLGYTLQQIAPRIRAYGKTLLYRDPLNIRDDIIHLARGYEGISERTITAMEIKFIDADGRHQTYYYDIPPDRSNITQR